MTIIEKPSEIKSKLTDNRALLRSSAEAEKLACYKGGQALASIIFILFSIELIFSVSQGRVGEVLSDVPSWINVGFIGYGVGAVIGWIKYKLDIVFSFRKTKTVSQQTKDSPLSKKPRTVAFEYGGMTALLVGFMAMLMVALIAIAQGLSFSIGGNALGWMLLISMVYTIGGCIGWLVYGVHKTIVFIWKAVVSIMARR